MYSSPTFTTNNATPTGACASGQTLQFYIANYASVAGQGGCSVGNETFTNFGYLTASVFANGISAADVIVTTGLNASGPSINFAADWRVNGQVASSGASESAVFFQVYPTSTPALTLNSVNLSAQGSRGVLSTAAAAEVDCLGGVLSVRTIGFSGLGGVGCLGGISAGATAGLPVGTNVTANATIPLSLGQPFVDILKDVSLVGLLGDASITSVGQQFSGEGTATPEPSTTVLFIGGLGMLAIARKKLRRG